MADSDQLIDAAATRTSDLISLATANAYAASGGAWQYKRAIDGTGGSSWFGTGSKAFEIPDGFQITAPIALPVERPVYVANTDISNEFRQAFEDAFGMFQSDVQDGLAQYIATYFPATVASHVDDWITNTILNGGQGIPAAIEALIWQRARSRESEEALKLEQEATDAMAMRGFSLPTGALVDALLRVQQASADKASTLSRDIAIKTFDAYREDVKYAVEMGAKVRLGVIGALGSFMQAWTAPQQNATEIAKVKVDSKSRLVSTAADYYRAIVSEAELNLRAQQLMANSQDSMARLRFDQDYQSEKLGVDASIATAQMFGQIAGSAASSLVSLVGSEKQLIGAVAS